MEKREKARLREERLKKEEQLRKEKEEQEERERAELEEKEREKQAHIKMKKEQEKKAMRKSRQALRKLVLALFQTDSSTDNPTWCNFDDMNDDVEMLCENLSALELDLLTNEITDTSYLNLVKNKANELRDDTAKAMKAEEREREKLRMEAKKKEEAAKAARASKPWSKEEISALTKAIKKYPAGGANRWETIALFVNNLCRLEEPRKKEECIEKYNQLANSSATITLSETKPTSTNNPSTNEWSEEQDKQLQTGLAKYPASMDKTERWTKIASEVTGKSKKECVARFKAIRDALKKSRSNVD
jgi:DnaJ family protein C protein 2